MEKEFVPYKLALELKELGFDEPCLDFYDDNQELFYNSENKDKIHIGDNVKAPLYQQAFRWFREKYNIIPNIHSVYIDETHTKINFWVWFANYEENSNEEIYYGTYEEAELECLKKLIEIVKDGK